MQAIANAMHHRVSNSIIYDGRDVIWSDFYTVFELGTMSNNRIVYNSPGVNKSNIF